MLDSLHLYSSKLKYKKTFFIYVTLIWYFSFTGCSKHKVKISVGWLETNSETRLWTRWGWLGNSIQFETLPQIMTQYQKVGFGGLEITPVYEVKNNEKIFINYLSPQWINILIIMLAITDSLDLGIDLANALGWPFGEPWISLEDICKNFVYINYKFQSDQQINQSIIHMQESFVRKVCGGVNIRDIKYPINENENLHKLALSQVRFQKALPLVSLLSYSNNGYTVDLIDKVDAEDSLKWEVYAVFQGWHRIMVERASPEGEGDEIDYFSRKALYKHLKTFESAFDNTDVSYIRLFFNDFYEVDDAEGEVNLTIDFFYKFKKRRGYDLRMYFPSLFNDVSTEKHMRILCDYREMISDLLLEESTLPWADRAHKHRSKTRNQAHDSPANILDLYAASDIPETEGINLINIKFASSTAHVTGKNLTSAEACIWLNGKKLLHALKFHTSS